MSNFTKGPWELIENSWAITTIYATDGQGIICESNIGSNATEETQDELESIQSADMHLIAAAPDMYEALEKLIDSLPIKHPSAWTEVEIQSILSNIRDGNKALTKAEGEQS